MAWCLLLAYDWVRLAAAKLEEARRAEAPRGSQMDNLQTLPLDPVEVAWPRLFKYMLASGEGGAS